MAVPNRRLSLSQFWLPSLLFVLSVVSTLFTLRNDEIPVMGPNERSVLDASDLEAHRKLINQALHGSGSWRAWCEKTEEALQALAFKNFDSKREDSRWTDQRRSLPAREQDALLRCQNADHRAKGPIHACLFLIPQILGTQGPTQTGLYLVELTLELRAAGRKKVLSCAEALASADQPLEMAAWYTFYWTQQTGRKPLHFERLTGGTRIFPPLVQNTERSTASSRP